jgi:integrase
MVTKQIKVMTDLDGYFKKGQREAIYSSCKLAYPNNEKRMMFARALIRLLWMSGRRISELIPLKVYDINQEKQLIRFIILKKGSKENKDEPKAKKNLKVYKWVDSETLDILNHHILINDLKTNDWLFPHPENPLIPMSRFVAHRIVRKLCKIAGIERVGEKKPHCHHFRHSLAIELAENSTSPKDIRLIQQQLEHSSLDVTQYYLQFNPKDIKELYRKAGYKVNDTPNK